MDGWFAGLDNKSALTTFMKQAVSTMEQGIDKVLDIHPEESVASSNKTKGLSIAEAWLY